LIKRGKDSLFLFNNYQVEQTDDVPRQFLSNSAVVMMDNMQQPSWKHFLKLWASTKLQLTRDHLTELCSLYTEETLVYTEKKFAGLNDEERALRHYQLVFTMLNMFDVRNFGVEQNVLNNTEI